MSLGLDEIALRAAGNGFASRIWLVGCSLATPALGHQWFSSAKFNFNTQKSCSS